MLYEPNFWKAFHLVKPKFHETESISLLLAPAPCPHQSLEVFLTDRAKTLLYKCPKHHSVQSG